MHKVLLISSLALALAGCAASQGEAPPPQVRDLSASRAASTPSEYTVKAGDTLYGIAWRHDMDYRDLARLNRISPPYRIQPGQRLALAGEGGAPAEAGGATAVASSSGAVATGLGAGDGGDDESLDWLLPDEQAVADNRRLTAEPSAQDATPNPQALAGAAEAGGAGPGPVYDYDSPGADGSLSERDLAERRARDQREAADAESNAEQGASAAAEERASVEQTVASRGETATRREAEPAPAEASTPAAEQPAAEAPRRYTPVEDVPWQWPAGGEVVGAFGEGGSITAGIDIAGQKGQPVKAAGPGIVVYAGSGVRGYGKLILLKHNDQFLSAYAHNDALRVKENDVVEAGEVIATMGDSDAEDVRLHFEVRKDGQPQDPLKFLPPR